MKLNKDLIYTFVYAKNSQIDRRRLWADLVRFAFNVQGPWLIAGYFKIGKICRRKGGGQKDPSKGYL